MEYDTVPHQLLFLCGNLILSRAASSLQSHDMHHQQDTDRDELFQNLSSAIEEVRFFQKLSLKAIFCRFGTTKTCQEVFIISKSIVEMLTCKLKSFDLGVNCAL